VRHFVDHPEHEWRLCRLLDIATEEDKIVQAAIAAASSARQSAVAAAFWLLSSFSSSLLRQNRQQASRSLFPLLGLLLLLAACGPSGSDFAPLAELPNPAIYAIAPDELPEVGANWLQSYNQVTEGDGYMWSYLAYEASQPAGLGGDLGYAFAVNNDVYLYETDVRRQDLPQPPQALGSIHGVSWQSSTQLHRLGDKSAVWKTIIGDLPTPVWWLEFYKGHAYVRISLFGFPDQVAPGLIYELGDAVATRLPESVEELRADAPTPAVVPAQRVPEPTTPPTTSATQSASIGVPDQGLLSQTPAVAVTDVVGSRLIMPIAYTAPLGETGLVTFFDDTGTQLTDGQTGTDDILADLGHGSAYEWVGWTEANDPVTLTFFFEGTVTISEVQIGLSHRDGFGVFVPSELTINAVVPAISYESAGFNLAADDVPNNQRADLTFSGPFTASQVQIILHHRGRGWILVDEIRFLQGR
jgi:hypothetical protein